jgi:beta-glucosidase
VVNVGERAGEEVVQLYVRDEEATVARPVRELRGFQRVHLAPGERRTVGFSLHAEQFAYTGADMRRVVEPGRVSLFVGRSSDDLPLQATIELTGPVVDLSVRRHYLTKTAMR